MSIDAAAIDYSVAGRWADVVHALALGESNENPAAVGDGGRAFGILQQHPAFFKEYYGICATVSSVWNLVEK
jgi:hypothetical protein